MLCARGKRWEAVARGGGGRRSSRPPRKLFLDACIGCDRVGCGDANEGEVGMAEWNAGSRKAIADDIATPKAALERLQAMDADLAKLGKLDVSSLDLGGTVARPTSLSRAVQLALRNGASPAAEVIEWVQRHYDDKAKPHSIRSTLAHRKKKGVVARGGKNWYLVEKDRQ